MMVMLPHEAIKRSVEQNERMEEAFTNMAATFARLVDKLDPMIRAVCVCLYAMALWLVIAAGSTLFIVGGGK